MPESSTTPANRGTMAGLVTAGAALLAGLGFATVEDDPSLVPAEVASLEPIEPAAESLAQLVVAEEDLSATYNRSAFRHWVDADGDGCNTRQEILQRDVQEDLAMAPGAKCKVKSGEWLSIYDGESLTNPSKLDIDHMVPLKEAWESGAAAWTGEERREYANDLDLPFLALLAVSASTNRSKADRDPAEWLPPDEDSWCFYATAWIAVKLKWSLTVDRAEHDALADMVERC